MNEIIIIFIILGTLFILENKSINLLAYYVGMVIIIAILISNYSNLSQLCWNNQFSMYFKQQNWEEIYNNTIGYISYILILVQISALTILFGFIIMLFPKNNTDILINNKKISQTISPAHKCAGGAGGQVGEEEKKNNIKIIISICLIIILLSFLKLYSQFFLQTTGNNELFPDWEKCNEWYCRIKDWFNWGYFFNFIPDPYFVSPIEMEQCNWEVIRKLYMLIYSEPSNIIKFMIITIILLFAIIGLFYILLPTYF